MSDNMKKRHIRQTNVNNVKELIWRRQVLNHSLTVVCDIKTPHMINIHEILLIGVSTPLPYALCPLHQAYFGVSADIDMKNKAIILRGRTKLWGKTR